MNDADKPRSAPEARRIVVKIGSRSLVASPGRFAALGAQLAALLAAGKKVIVVSSGAIALGRGRLGFTKRPTDIAELQACAAVGQSLLMRAWEEALLPHGLPVAQILLTHADLSDRERWRNGRAAIDALLELGCVPIINENDTVAVEEIKFGDNDQLAAMVATLAGADLLVLLTDVEGLLDRQGQRVSSVSDMAEARALIRKSGDDVGSGGMDSKLDAAHRATRRGIPAVIADARDDGTLPAILRGDDVGTLFLPHGTKLASRKHWIAYTLRPRGVITVDAGAAAALATGKSLLPRGVVAARGDFAAGDAITIEGPDGLELGRGLSRYKRSDVTLLIGASTKDIGERLGFHDGDEIVHRDDLVTG